MAGGSIKGHGAALFIKSKVLQRIRLKIDSLARIFFFFLEEISYGAILVGLLVELQNKL